jgi:hypothetical protein
MILKESLHVLYNIFLLFIQILLRQVALHNFLYSRWSYIHFCRPITAYYFDSFRNFTLNPKALLFLIDIFLYFLWSHIYLVDSLQPTILTPLEISSNSQYHWYSPNFISSFFASCHLDE